MTELGSGAATAHQTIKPLTRPINRAIRLFGRKYYVLKSSFDWTNSVNILALVRDEKILLPVS